MLKYYMAKDVDPTMFMPNQGNIPRATMESAPVAGPQLGGTTSLKPLQHLAYG
jgi:hypothetical protein